MAAVGGALACALGLVVLAGWVLGIEGIKSLDPSWPTMKANTAVGLVALGLGFLAAALDRHRLAQTLAVVPIVLAALTLLQVATGVSLGIDEALVDDPDPASGDAGFVPGRMPSLTAVAFLLLGTGLVTWNRPNRVGNLAVLAAGFIALYNLVTYFLDSTPRIAGMAMHTAAAVFLLATTFLLGRPGLLAKTVLGRTRTSRDARLLLVAVFVLPLALSWAAHRAYELGTLDFDQQAVSALFANLAVLAILVLFVLLRLRREEERRAILEADLRRNLQRFDAAERATGRGSWEWDVAADRAVWSEGMYRLLGQDPRTFANSTENLLALVHPDDREQVAKAFADALQTPGPFHQEYRVVRPDGSRIHVQSDGGVVTEAEGDGTVLSGIVQDVTRLRQLEKARHAAQDRFARVFEASPVAIALTKEDGRLVNANPAFRRLSGYAQDDLDDPAFSVRQLYADPQDRDRLLVGLRTAGLVRGVEVDLRRKDGSMRSVLISLEFVDLGGNTTILSLFQDVTERKRAQAEREARIASESELDRLRRTEEFRRQFINSTAHELRTPLTPLLLSVGSLQARLGADEAAARSLAAIQRSTDRLRRVVEDMVSAAEVQARSMALDLAPLDLADAVRSAVATHADAAQRTGLRIETSLEPELTVRADEQRLQLVLGHLLGNALKFTAAGGLVTVASRRRDGQAGIEVTDTGIGLTRAQIERLWKPFAQEHDKGQRTDSGSGLGLYVSKGIVNLHGGEVGCSSPGPGKGSTFWFTLPLAPEP